MKGDEDAAATPASVHPADDPLEPSELVAAVTAAYDADLATSPNEGLLEPDSLLQLLLGCWAGLDLSSLLWDLDYLPPNAAQVGTLGSMVTDAW